MRNTEIEARLTKAWRKHMASKSELCSANSPGRGLPPVKMPFKIVVWLLLFQTTDFAFGISEGDTAPDFTLSGFDGGQSVSLVDYSDRIVYLDFWASWCGPCRVSIPEIVKLHDDLGSENFTVIAVSVDKKVGDGLKFLKQYPVNYLVLSDTTGETAAKFELPGMPTSFVIDHGKISLIHKGYRSGDMDKIRKHIEERLDEAY